MKNENYILREFDEAAYKIVNEGFDIEDDRTGIGTRCLFGLSTKYDISKRVKKKKKRKVNWQSILKEVLWYISGSSNINDLENMGSKIWTPWKNNKFTDKHNLPEGSGGYLYGFNLIHFGANIYKNIKRKEYEKNNPNILTEDDLDRSFGTDSKGFNQLDYVINTLKNNPKSRQACFTFWRPDTNDQAILPACHAFYSFVVSPDENGELNVLNCHVFQRSNDYLIGVSHGNLWTATLFTYMIAQQLNMKPGTLYHSGSHCHIYHNQLQPTEQYPNSSPAEELLSREEEPNSPILILNKRDSIYDYVVEDFVIEDYNPLPSIKFPIAV